MLTPRNDCATPCARFSFSKYQPKISIFEGITMVRRVALEDTNAVIQSIKEDGGVILTNFSSTEDVERVNADAAPYIQKIVDDVYRPDHSSSLSRLTTRNSAHHNPSLEKRLDVTVCSDEVGWRERVGFNSLHFLTSLITSYGPRPCRTMTLVLP